MSTNRREVCRAGYWPGCYMEQEYDIFWEEPSGKEVEYTVYKYDKSSRNTIKQIFNDEKHWFKNGTNVTISDKRGHTENFTVA